MACFLSLQLFHSDNSVHDQKCKEPELPGNQSEYEKESIVKILEWKVMAIIQFQDLLYAEDKGELKI